MKKIMSVFLLLMLTACVGYVVGSSGLQLNNTSRTWYIRDISKDIVTLTYHNLPEIYVRLDLRNILYNAGLSQSDCRDKINADGINVIYPIVIYVGEVNGKTDKSVQYALNPSKSYFIKNNQRYPLKIIDIFNLRASSQDQYYNFSKGIEAKGYVAKSFSSPLICGELEQAILVIGGIKINNHLLSPIELQFNFSNPQSLPLLRN